MHRRILMSLAVAAALAGCASNVKLDDVPVEDKRASAVSQQPGGTAPGAGGGTGGATQSRVA